MEQYLRGNMLPRHASWPFIRDHAVFPDQGEYQWIPLTALERCTALRTVSQTFKQGGEMREEVKAMQARLEERAHIVRLGRLFSETVLLKIDEEEYYLVFEKGRISEIRTGPSKKIPYCFAVTTDADALARFWQPRPEPGFHDIFGLVKIGRAQILGDILTLVKNLRFLKDVLALPREGRA